MDEFVCTYLCCWVSPLYAVLKSDVFQVWSGGEVSISFLERVTFWEHDGNIFEEQTGGLH